MTPSNVTQNPASYYAWLQLWMTGGPTDPRQGLGPMAERSEQTIEERRTTNIGPVHRSDFRPSEDELNLVSKQPVPDVEILTGRAAS